MSAPKPLTRLIELLHQALRAQSQLGPEHPLAQKSGAELEAFLPELLAELGTVTVEVSGTGFTCRGEPVAGAPNAAQALARELEDRGIGGLEFHPGLDPEEIHTLLFVLQLRPQRLAEMGGAATLLPEDGPLLVLPLLLPEPAQPELPMPAPGEPPTANLGELDPAALADLEWERLLNAATPASIPEMPDPIPWLAPAGAEPLAALPPTVPQAFPEPAPLTAEEMQRVPQAPPPEAPPPPPPPLPSQAVLRDELEVLFRTALTATTPVDRAGARSPWGVEQREALTRFGFQVPDFAPLAGLGGRLGLEARDPGSVREALRKTLTGFEPMDQGHVLLGLPGFPAGEHALRRALDFLAPELLAQAVAHAHLVHQPSMFDLALLTVALMQCVADRDLSLEAIRGRLQFEGWGMQEVEDFKEAIQWECQGTDTKLHMSLERHAIHKLDPHLVMTLGRQLIRGKRVDDLRSMLAQLEEELASPHEAVRRHGTEILANVADGLQGAGLPMDLENRILASARDRLSAENDQLVAQWCAQAVEAILNRWLSAGNFRALHTEMRNLGELAYPTMGGAAWKPQLLRDLLARLGSPQNITMLIPLLFKRGTDLPAAQIHGILGLIGAPAAAHLAAALEIEADPSRRVHLVEALRAMGPRAVPVIRELLASAQWNVVDDAVMLLAQAGDKAVLPDLVLAISHQDVRVRRTAVTAVSALGGPAAAAKALAGTLGEADPGAQMEILAMLADLGEPVAAPAVLRLLNPDRASGEEAQRLRVRAAETLGRLPGSDSVRPLLEVLQKKGLFKGREPAPLRLAAARALAALNTPEAREAMALAMESEPSEDVKTVLRQNLVR